MLRNKVMISVVGVLFALVVIYNLNFFLSRKNPVGHFQKVVSAGFSGSRGKSGQPLMSSPFPVPRDRAAWKRDPFLTAGGKGEHDKAAVRQKEKVADIKLQGIMADGGKYSALVNGWVVESGDRIGDALITDITPYGIVVKDAGGSRRINIYYEKLDKEK
jgi:hypothetical protein